MRSARLGSRLPETDTVPKRVAVVGGGAAGMEAARVAATRGHDVTSSKRTPCWEDIWLRRRSQASRKA